MIKEVASIDLPVHERMVVRKNRLTPQDYTGGSVPRISIVTGTHGDELDGQYICYEIIRRINIFVQSAEATFVCQPRKGLHF